MQSNGPHNGKYVLIICDFQLFVILHSFFYLSNQVTNRSMKYTGLTNAQILEYLNTILNGNNPSNTDYVIVNILILYTHANLVF